MHPVITEKLAAERIRDMLAQGDNARRARQARPARQARQGRRGSPVGPARPAREVRRAPRRRGPRRYAGGHG